MQASLERQRQRRRELKGDEGGFTLIELLIVIVILGILAAIVVFAVSNLSKDSSVASCGTDVATVQSAAETYKAEIGVYPGGTITTGYSLTAGNAVTVKPEAGYPADGTSPATDYTTAMTALLSTWGNGTSTDGPYLKTTPYNAGHYSIVLSDDGNGTVSVVNGAGTLVPAGCSGLTN